MLDFLPFSSKFCAWLSCRVTLLLVSLLAYPVFSFGEECNPACVVNVVWENTYHTGVPVTNLYYHYVPNSQWAVRNCEGGGAFAEQLTRTPQHDDIGFLFGWAKYYYNGTSWTSLGGMSAKYYITQTTPFHAAADLITSRSDASSDKEIQQALNTTFPQGCSSFPIPKYNLGSPDQCQ